MRSLMPEFARLVPVLLSSLLAAGLAGADCGTARQAHERWLAGSFTVERRLHISLNGDLVKLQVARLSYVDGELDTEVVEDEVLAKSVAFDGEGDMVVAIPFACDRLRSVGSGRFELSSEDGTETALFELDLERRALVPVEWRLEARERFLFKKLHLDGRAEYSNFEWRRERAVVPESAGEPVGDAGT